MQKKTTQRIDVRDLMPTGELVYLEGDATTPQGNRPKIIAHICNDVGAWGQGFVMALSKRWAEPEAAYREWHAGREKNDFHLGGMQLVAVDAGVWVANIIAQHGLSATAEGPPIRYSALEMGLHAVADRARQLGATVHMPRIGCGLAGGSWDHVEEVVCRSLARRRIGVFVYDLKKEG